MILDNLENADRYFGCADGLKQAIKFINDNELDQLPDCKLKIKGDDVYLTIAEVEGKSKDECRLEAHRDYIDIHIVVDAEETMGWKATEDCNTVIKEYDEQDDIEYYDDEPDTYFTLREGMFAVFFPEDAHMPLIAPGKKYKKIIAKVKA